MNKPTLTVKRTAAKEYPVRKTTAKWKWLLFGLGLTFPLAAHAFDIDWNGFGSVYYGQALDRNALPYGFSDTHANFTSFSLAGLNVTGKISDNLDFAGQIVALGSPVGTSDVFSVIFQWASVSYHPMDNILIKAGRQLYPVLLASEYAHVGFLLPYSQIPSSIFLISPFSRFDGLSAYYSVDTAVGKLTAGIFGGTPDLDSSTTGLSEVQEQLTLGNLYGAQATLDGDGWRLHGMASSNYTALTSMSSAFPELNGHTQTFSTGYRYDKFNVVSWGEYAMSRTPDGGAWNGGRYVGNGHGYYLLGGYRIGPVTPRYTFSQGSTTYNIPLGANSLLANGGTTSHTVGLNIQVASQATLKLDFEHDIVTPPLGPSGYFATGPVTTTNTTGNAFFVGLDFIF